MPTSHGNNPAGTPMLCRFTDLRRYAIRARDGDVGTIEDAYFDDQLWTVRYLVVDTGTWLSGRKVLLSPAAIADLDDSGLRVETTLLGTEGTGWDVGWATVFLASDEARWITGAALPVDGGIMAVTPLMVALYLRSVPVPSVAQAGTTA